MNKAPRSQRWPILLALVLVWLAVSACSCGDKLVQVKSQVDKQVDAQTATAATAKTKAAVPTSTPVPTKAPTATPVPTTEVSAQSQAKPSSASEASEAVDDKRYDLTFTEEEINDLLAGQSMSQQGVEVEDVTVRITANEVIADLRGTYAEAGISAGIQVVGVPVVHNGDLYIDIKSVELDDSVSGFMRLIADQLVKQAIEQYSTEYGIYVPQEDIIFESIELMPQAVRVVGEQR